MTDRDILKEITRVAKACRNVNGAFIKDGILRENTSFKYDLRVGGLDKVVFIGEIESTFDFEFNNEELINIKTVGDLLNSIKKKLIQA